MTATRNQRALAGEPLPDGDTPEYSPRTKERLAAVETAELRLVAEDKEYHASTLAAEVAVYGTVTISPRHHVCQYACSGLI